MKKPDKTVFRLGVTGGIGSGKTTICKVFAALGIPVFYADHEARLVMDNDRTIMDKINSAVGRDMYLNGSLDRGELAGLIFNDGFLLGKINSIVHPVVFDRFTCWSAGQTAPYVIMEAAILFESGASELVDKVLTVVTPMEERIERMIRGKKLTRQQLTERINNQMDDEARIRKSDYVIYNSENDMIVPAVLKVHNEIINKVKR